MEHILTPAEALPFAWDGEEANPSPPVPGGRGRYEQRLSLLGAVLIHAGVLALMMAVPDHKPLPPLPAEEVVQVSLHAEEASPAEDAALAAATAPSPFRPAPAVIRRPRTAPTPAPVPQPVAAQTAEKVVSESPAELSARTGQAMPADREGAAHATPQTGTATAAGMAALPEVAARPLARNNPPPVYPEQARRRELEGTVVLQASVNTEGRVDAVAVHASCGHSLLDEAALRAVRNWLFEPGRRGGTPMAMKILVPVRFTLRQGTAQ